jgi:outer membrane protein OmpA-like peptidoglycan-associated protein
MQENRRVEISSKTPDLTEPVKIEDRKALSVGTTQVRYDVSITPDPSARNYKSWTIALDQDGTPIGTPISGTGAPPATTTTPIPDAEKYLNQPIHYTMVVTDDQGQTGTGEGLTRVVAKTVDRDNLEKFAMLSFDFDRAEINQRARQMLQLISESISRDAIGVKIDGYCDSTGRAEYNQTLSEARANTAITTLRSMTTLPANVTVHGHGFRDLRFDNELPEGRQLDRRVEITIDKSSH